MKYVNEYANVPLFWTKILARTLIIIIIIIIIPDMGQMLQESGGTIF